MLEPSSVKKKLRKQERKLDLLSESSKMEIIIIASALAIAYQIS
jgi:hypothetical protein